MNSPSAIDWQTIVVKTCRAVGSERKVAKLAGMSYSTLGEIARSATRHPMYDTGTRLLALYSQHVAKVDGAEEVARLLK